MNRALAYDPFKPRVNEWSDRLVADIMVSFGPMMLIVVILTMLWLIQWAEGGDTKKFNPINILFRSSDSPISERRELFIMRAAVMGVFFLSCALFISRRNGGL